MRQSARAQPPCLRAAAPPGFAGPQTAGALADATVEPPTPLQLEVTRLGRWLELVVVLIAVVVATLLLLAPVHSLADAVPVLLLAVSLATRCAPWRWPHRPLGDGEAPPAAADDAAAAPAQAHALEQGLVLIGLVGLIDPPRAEAAVAITQAHSAGIRVIMINDDHLGTAARIAADLGLVGAPADRAASVLTGAQLDALDAAGLAAAVRSIAVYARVAPAHKLRIVAALLFGLQGGAGGGAVVLPLLATQLLWINLVTDSAPALAFGVDPPVGDLMARPPCWCWPACSTA